MRDVVAAALGASIGALLGALAAWWSGPAWLLACVTAGAVVGALVAPGD